MQKYK